MASSGQSSAHGIADAGTAEKEVADLLPIEAEPAVARAALERVPFWFHTFALNRAEGIYAPGVARDHRYRIPAFPADFGGAAVLDLGTFDGFYAFLAENRNSGRVVAVDNEQYRAWVRSRWGVDLVGGEGFREIHELLSSGVEYRRLDAFELDRLDERFDVILCFGILHRVELPGRLLEVLRRRLSPGGEVLVETYGSSAEHDDGAARIVEHRPGEVYEGDAYVFWGFSPGGIEAIGAKAGFRGFELVDAPIVDGHPRVLGRLHG